MAAKGFAFGRIVGQALLSLANAYLVSFVCRQPLLDIPFPTIATGSASKSMRGCDITKLTRCTFAMCKYIGYEGGGDVVSVHLRRLLGMCLDVTNGDMLVIMYSYT